LPNDPIATMTKEKGTLKVALLQLSATQDSRSNLDKALSMSREAIAQKAKFILLPEVFNYRGDTKDKGVLAKVTEIIPGPSTEAFVALAKRCKVSFLLGSILEKATDSKAYNSSVLIDPQGKITAKYRKIHLFDALIGEKWIKESDTFRPGRRPATAKLGDFKVGLSICYDLRFPSLYQEYAHNGVDVLAVPSCFTRKTGIPHWEVLLRARAIENLAYVLAPDQVGTDSRGIQAHGHSMIISPWGEIIARGSGDRQEIVFGEIELEEVQKARRMLPGVITGGRHDKKN